MKLTFPLLNTTITVPVDDIVSSGKISRRSLRKKAENKIIEQAEKTEKVDEGTEIKSPVNSEKTTEELLHTSVSQSGNPPILIVEVINVTHEKFKQTEEIKVTHFMKITDLHYCMYMHCSPWD